MPVKAGLTATLLTFATLAGCSFYGASFDCPDKAPVPDWRPWSSRIRHRTDDDPMRSRQQVIDIRETAPSTFLDFYREAYPAEEGWEDAKRDGSKLCLVNGSNEDYTEVLEVFPYEGSRVRDVARAPDSNDQPTRPGSKGPLRLCRGLGIERPVRMTPACPYDASQVPGDGTHSSAAVRAHQARVWTCPDPASWAAHMRHASGLRQGRSLSRRTFVSSAMTSSLRVAMDRQSSMAARK